MLHFKVRMHESFAVGDAISHGKCLRCNSTSLKHAQQSMLVTARTRKHQKIPARRVVAVARHASMHPLNCSLPRMKHLEFKVHMLDTFAVGDAISDGKYPRCNSTSPK
jgi:hypothetical protein